MSKMIQCKSCSKEIASNEKFCPGCGAKNKKPIYKRPWFIVIAFFVIVGAIGSAGGGDSTKTNSGTTGTEQEISKNQKTEENASVEEKVEEDVPTEYKSALEKAKIYSDTMNMSKAGLYDQLISEYGEKFSKKAAKYAIDNVDANWKENALKKAKTYQESMAMSPKAIYDQLTSEYGEKFTKKQAKYAIDNLE
ncbi:Ltp family lipoprotein [Terrisporobacter petrolearius]|uniref:Ltp family lipoprotein n=1 Tax=Terrisporobacter petrolearius TaxID=1460447 RepID=UPI001D162DF2|nr:Ltp family lipoprotein [Terrisporobacter petrolearius]MCC3864956.1 Ltp family lipoprotein [Terrisporobacter petrolearius]